MLQLVAIAVLWVSSSTGHIYHLPYNATRSTISGIAAYRSALTLDWLAGEDLRQRELVNAFETEGTPNPRSRNADCILYSRPAPGKVAKLMLELLRNLEGDEGSVIPDLIQTLIRTKLLVETSMLDAEPDLESLVLTPGVMMGEPHTTFPRILAMTWMVAVDPITTKKSGWCSIKKLNQFLSFSRPPDIAKHMRALDPVIARARFVMEEFIHNVTPLNIYPEGTTTPELREFGKPAKGATARLTKTSKPPRRFNRPSHILSEQRTGRTLVQYRSFATPESTELSLPPTTQSPSPVSTDEPPGQFAEDYYINDEQSARASKLCLILSIFLILVL